MTTQWTIESLSNWAVETGLQPRHQGSSNRMSFAFTNDSKPLFNIKIEDDESDFCSVVAVNEGYVRTAGLSKILQDKFELLETENSFTWIKFGIDNFEPTALEIIAGWVIDKKLITDAPAPKIITKQNRILTWLSSFLADRGMERTDGRPLYAYKTTDEEFKGLTTILNIVSTFRGQEIFRKDQKFEAVFVLFATEWWRRDYHGGSWTWLPIYKAIGLEGEATSALQASPQGLLYPALERGFKYWKREIYTMGQGRRFIGSIAAEGGLPLNLLIDPNSGLQRFFKHLLDRFMPARASGIPASQIASELQHDLPASFRRETVFRLAGEIVETTLELRSQYGIADNSNPIAHLDSICPEWRDRFPLAMDNEPAQVLLRALVVDAAKASDTGAPLVLSRLIVKEPGDKYRLKASIDMSRKLSIASLGYLFGDIEWPSQLEIWLTHPFKARLAVLSRIDDDHFKVRNETVVWYGKEAGAEVTVCLFSYGSKLTESRELLDSILEDELPWVFVEKNNDLRYLGQGSMSLAAENVVLVLPPNFHLTQDDSSIHLDELGEIEDVERLIFQGNGTLKVSSDDGFFTIKTRQAKLEIPSYGLIGKRFYREANVKQIFLGAPNLRVQDIGGGYTNLPSYSVLWRYAGTGEEWKAWSNTMEGIVDIKAMDGNAILFRSRVAVLPRNTSFSISAGNNDSTGEIKITGLTNLRLESQVEGLEIKTTQNGSGEVVLALRRIDNCLSSFSLPLQWPHIPYSLNLRMPIPVAAAQFRDANGSWLTDGHFISVSDLAGIHAVAFNHSGGAPEKLQLYIGVSARDLKTADLRSLSESVPLIQMGEVSELPLIQLREKILQLFALSEDLECQVELTLDRYGKINRLKIARYTSILKICDHKVALELASYNGNVDQSLVEDLTLEAHSLLNPVERGKELNACLSQDVATGDWQIPVNLKEGPWLIMPSRGQNTPVRPTLFLSAGFKPGINGGLRDAFSIASEFERKNRIGECIQQMQFRYDHKDWRFVYENLSAFEHLPATTLDLWGCFAHNPSAMAMLLIAADETNYRSVISLANELPFSWELVPFSSWLSALTSLKEFIVKSAPVSMTEAVLDNVVKQKMEYVSTADKLLEKVTWILTEIILQKPNSALNDARPYGVPGIIELSIGDVSGKLRARQGALTTWPNYHGSFLDDIRNVSPATFWPLYTNQADYMAPVLHAPVAMAIRSHALSTNYIHSPTNTELYQLQLIRHFDEIWYQDAFELTVLYLYATNNLTQVPTNSSEIENN
jgi:hypothetical protein